MKGKAVSSDAKVARFKTFDASKKPRGTLDVEFQWSGKDLTLTVADACAGPRPMGSQGAP